MHVWEALEMKFAISFPYLLGHFCFCRLVLTESVTMRNWSDGPPLWPQFYHDGKTDHEVLPGPLTDTQKSCFASLVTH